MSDKKRLFFGLEVQAPWDEVLPDRLPEGRVLDVSVRHVTLAFLGSCDYGQLEPHLSKLPTLPLPLRVGSVGVFDELLFLPKRHPRVIAWHPHFYEKQESLEEFQKILSVWLAGLDLNFSSDKRPWLPHVTMVRSPFNEKKWKKLFNPLPMMTTDLHLYESLGHLQYRSIWQREIVPPLVEIPHTADLAYQIVGETLSGLYLHAQIALAFSFPNMLNYLDFRDITRFDEIVIALNDIVARADAAEGAPIKAVSFHGEVQTRADNLLEWEMIVDV